jgi:hypothetical protein
MLVDHVGPHLSNGELLVEKRVERVSDRIEDGVLVGFVSEFGIWPAYRMSSGPT